MMMRMMIRTRNSEGGGSTGELSQPCRTVTDGNMNTLFLCRCDSK